MVSKHTVEQQLKGLKFNFHGWGRSEVRELPHILLPDEEISECVNGMYEGGFALLVATDLRLLLIDKKPLNYLTVEDLRFEMITELDYNHRLIGAQISINAGTKNLKFKSYNQQRLRKLLTHVQHCMVESKKRESSGQQDQKQHLEQINQQLQAYLIAQHQQQEALRLQLEGVVRKSDASSVALPEPAKPSPELSDFLFAQSLLKQYREQEGKMPAAEQLYSGEQLAIPAISTAPPSTPTYQASAASPHMAELYAEGMQEIYGRKAAAQQQPTPPPTPATPIHNPLEINPLSIAYSKLPMALRNRKFGRPSFHAHSQQPIAPPATQHPATAN
jgi:hypothetical protein